MKTGGHGTRPNGPAVAEIALAQGPDADYSHLACSANQDHAMNAANQLGPPFRQIDRCAGCRAPFCHGRVCCWGLSNHFRPGRDRGFGLYGGLPFAQAQARWCTTCSIPDDPARLSRQGESVAMETVFVAERVCGWPPSQAVMPIGIQRGLVGQAPRLWGRAIRPARLSGRVSMDLAVRLMFQPASMACRGACRTCCGPHQGVDALGE